MAKLLEVIVTSLDEAREAAAGGADRLELVRDLRRGGLTPTLSVAEAVLAAVHIPVRLMVRENDSMAVQNDAELESLERQAEAFSHLSPAGLVTGFVSDGELDGDSLSRLSATAPHSSITFHRAFEQLRDPEAALAALQRFSKIDRILVRVGAPFSIARLQQLQALAEPRIRLIAGIGLAKQYLPDLQQAESLTEVHVGRAVREPEVVDGAVSRYKVEALKKALA